MFGIDPKFCMNAYLVVRDNRYYCHFQTYLPPVIVGSGEQQEDLAFLHPDLLAVLGDVLEVVVDDDEHLPVPILHPDPHRVLLLASVTHVTSSPLSSCVTCHVSQGSLAALTMTFRPLFQIIQSQSIHDGRGFSRPPLKRSIAAAHSRSSCYHEIVKYHQFLAAASKPFLTDFLLQWNSGQASNISLFLSFVLVILTSSARNFLIAFHWQGLNVFGFRPVLSDDGDGGLSMKLLLQVFVILISIKPIQ